MYPPFFGGAAHPHAQISSFCPPTMAIGLSAAFALLPLPASAQDVPSLAPTTVVAPAHPRDQQSGSLATGISGSTLDVPFR
jgi:hypothetical protein